MLLATLQWGIWVLSLLLFIGWLSDVRRNAKNNQPIHMATLAQTTFLLLAPVCFIIFSWNKFHLLWIVPTCLVLGWITSFVIMRIPLIRGLLSFLYLMLGTVLLVA